MANKHVVFSDRIVGLSVQNGLVRIELAVVSGSAKGKDGKAKVQLEVTHQLVMPLEGFAASVGMQDKLLKELVAREKKRRAGPTAMPAVAAAE